jgi:hypothetical protein
MVAVASAVGELAPAGMERLDRAMASVAGSAGGNSYSELAEKRDRLLALA